MFFLIKAPNILLHFKFTIWTVRNFNWTIRIKVRESLVLFKYEWGSKSLTRPPVWSFPCSFAFFAFHTSLSVFLSCFFMYFFLKVKKVLFPVCFYFLLVFPFFSSCSSALLSYHFLARRFMLIVPPMRTKTTIFVMTNILFFFYLKMAPFYVSNNIQLMKEKPCGRTVSWVCSWIEDPFQGREYRKLWTHIDPSRRRSK